MSVISATQMKAARAILAWRQLDLAAACGLSLNTIRSIEGGTLSRMATSNAIHQAIKDAGLELLDDDGIKRCDAFVKIYKGKDSCDKFFRDLLGSSAKSGNEIALSLHSAETHAWFFSAENSWLLERLNQPATARTIKCLACQALTHRNGTQNFEVRLTLRQNFGRLPGVISRDQYAVIAHPAPDMPPYFVSFRIPHASRAYLEEFRAAWRAGEAQQFANADGKQIRGRSRGRKMV